MNQVRWRIVIMSGIVSALVFSGAMSASAANVWGSYGSIGSYAGHSYQGRSAVDIQSSYIGGGSEIKTAGGERVPAGYMGVSCRVFTGGGALKEDAGYSFNSSATSLLGYFCSYRSPARGTYYSWGVGAYYNGNGNSYTYTPKSPTQNYNYN